MGDQGHRTRRKRGTDSGAFMERGRFAVLRARDLKALPKEDTDEVEFQDRSPEKIRRNLQILLDRYSIDDRRASKEIGVDGRWFRRLMKQGLSRRMPNLDKVAVFFGLPDGDYLWADDIERFLGPAPPRPETLDSLTQQMNWPFALRLLELLDTGRHDYLKGLVDGIHRIAFTEPIDGVPDGRTMSEKPGTSSSSANFEVPQDKDWSKEKAYVMPGESDLEKEAPSKPRR